MHSKGRHASGVARDGLGLRLASRRSDVTNRLGALVWQSTMEISGSITPPNTSLCADRSGSGGAPLQPAYIVPRAYVSSEGCVALWNAHSL